MRLHESNSSVFGSSPNISAVGIGGDLLFYDERAIGFTSPLAVTPVVLGPWAGPTVLFPRGCFLTSLPAGENLVATPNHALLLGCGERVATYALNGAFAVDGVTLLPSHCSAFRRLREYAADGFRPRSLVVLGMEYVNLRRWYNRTERVGKPSSGAGYIEQLCDWLDAWTHQMPGRHFRNRCTRDRRAVVERVKERIARNPTESPSLVVLARSADVPPYYLARSFQIETGYSIKSFAHVLKMRIAYEQIDMGRVKLADVCKWLGYAQDRHLVRALRLCFGLLPLALRQRGVP